MVAVTICSDFGVPQNKVSYFPLFPHLFTMKWWNQMPWSLFSECWVLSQLFHSPLSLSSRGPSEETRIERDMCTPMFTLARTWKQPICPSADEWIRKLWYIYRMEYYSAIKKNAFESVLMRWMKLEPIIQSEVSQKEKHQYSILTHIYGI